MISTPDFEPDGLPRRTRKLIKRVAQITEAMKQYVQLQKQQLLDISLIELEGKIPANEQLMRHAIIHKRGPDDELVVWKGKPLIWFGCVEIQEDDNGQAYPAIQYRFLYNVDIEPPPDESPTTVTS